MKSEMQRAVVLAQKMFGQYWHQLSFEQKHSVLEEARREMRGEVVEPRNTREFEIMSRVGVKLDLGGIAGGLRGGRVSKKGAK